MKRFLVSLGYALEGIRFGITTQRHLRFHLVAACLALAAGVWKGLQPVAWGGLVLLIAAVFAAGLMNTALEAVVDLVSPRQHPLAKGGQGYCCRGSAGAGRCCPGDCCFVILLLILPSYQLPVFSRYHHNA